MKFELASKRLTFRFRLFILAGEKKSKVGQDDMALTRRQREIYDFIREFIERTGYSPSLEEIGTHFELSSVATVHKHIQHLIQKGFLRREWNRSRSIEPLTEERAEAVTLPLLGAVAAGIPIEAVEVLEHIAVPLELVRRRSKSFVLRVRGNSMIDEQICDGDYVVVESTPVARDGETVVALIRGEETTLKKMFRRGNQIVLQPANQSMQPLEFPAQDVEIRGVVRGLLRAY